MTSAMLLGRGSACPRCGSQRPAENSNTCLRARIRQHCVRPTFYYADAHVPEVSQEGDDGREEEEAERLASRADKLETALSALTAAAQQYARVWSIGSEKEAAAVFAGGRFRGGEVESKLAELCSAARDFSESLG